jgi:hypothetical protein
LIDVLSGALPEPSYCLYRDLRKLTFMVVPQAIRNLVGIEACRRRRLIDMVASEYAYFAPQSQQTRYVSPPSVKTRLR